jgi:alkylhydroperoxidase/carboxymuconolactone decarboxylase family protein
MSDTYYDPKDLEAFAKIADQAPDQGEKFFEYYESATSPGALSEREKALIALTVATVRHCPYCIDACTNTCMSLGISKDEMMEAIHVGAAMCAGDILAHATQMLKIANKKDM